MFDGFVVQVVVVNVDAMPPDLDDFSWTDTRFGVWRVSDPVVGSDADAGLITFGDSREFAVEEFEFAGLLPAEMALRFTFSVEDGSHEVEAIVRSAADFVPTYPVGTDPMSIDFYWGSSRGGSDLASFDEMNDGTCVTAYRF